MDYTVEFRGWLKEGAWGELEHRLRSIATQHEWDVRWMEFEEFPLMRPLREDTTKAGGFDQDEPPRIGYGFDRRDPEWDAGEWADDHLDEPGEDDDESPL